MLTAPYYDSNSVSSTRQASSNLISQQLLVVAKVLSALLLTALKTVFVREQFPNHFGTRDGFHGKQSFHGQELRGRGWSRMIQAHHVYYAAAA